MTTGERIHNARKRSGLTQKELGEILSVSASMIGQYENGLRNPKRKTLKRIASALGVDWMELLPESQKNSNKTIGESIKNIRAEKGMTQKQVAEKAGLADSAIRKYESGRIEPKLENLKRLAAALGVDWMELVPGENESVDFEHIGENIQKFRRYESGERAVNKETLNRIADAFDVKLGELIRGTSTDNDYRTMTTGQLIRQARKKSRMTQTELAKKMGIPFQGISQWENDKRKPKYDTIKKIAAAIGIEPSELLGEETQVQDCHTNTLSIYQENICLKNKIKLIKILIDDLYDSLDFTDEG